MYKKKTERKFTKDQQRFSLNTGFSSFYLFLFPK